LPTFPPPGDLSGVTGGVTNQVIPQAGYLI
jgi:hypothetical protein